MNSDQKLANIAKAIDYYAAQNYRVLLVLPIRIANPKDQPWGFEPAAERPAMISRPIAAPIHAPILKAKN